MDLRLRQQLNGLGHGLAAKIDQLDRDTQESGPQSVTSSDDDMYFVLCDII